MVGSPTTALKDRLFTIPQIKKSFFSSKVYALPSYQPRTTLVKRKDFRYKRGAKLKSQYRNAGRW